MDQETIVYKEESYKIQGAIFEVYKELGPGFLESVYQEALEKEFLLQNIPFKRQIEIEISYKDQVLDHKYRADLICYDTIILELKACKAIEPIHRAQVMNYLKATKMKLGLLINFNSFPGVKIERIVR